MMVLYTQNPSGAVCSCCGWAWGGKIILAYAAWRPVQTCPTIVPSGVPCAETTIY